MRKPNLAVTIITLRITFLGALSACTSTTASLDRLPYTNAPTIDFSDRSNRLIYIRNVPTSCKKADRIFPEKLEPTIGNIILLTGGLLIDRDLPLSNLASQAGSSGSFQSRATGRYFLELNSGNRNETLRYLSSLESSEIECVKDKLEELRRQLRVTAAYPFGAQIPTSAGPVQREQKIDELNQLISKMGSTARNFRTAYGQARASVIALTEPLRPSARPDLPISRTPEPAPNTQTPREPIDPLPPPNIPETSPTPPSIEPNPQSTESWNGVFEIIAGLLGNDCRVSRSTGCA